MSKVRASKQVNASGTPSSTTYLRGDDTWATPAGAPLMTNAHRAAAESIANGAGVFVTFDASDFDDGSWYDPGTDATKITVANTGRYLITALGSYAATFSAFTVQWSIFVNAESTGRAVRVDTTAGGGSPYVITITVVLALTAGDYLRLQAFQTSGGSFNTSTTYPPALTVVQLA